MGEFEQIPEIAERIKRSKMELQDNGNYWTPEWDSQSCCDQDFVNNFKKGWQHQQAIINEHTEVIKLQDTDLRKYEKQIESLKEHLNNMEACYIEKKKQVEELQGQIDASKSSQPKLHKTEIGDCLHFSTTMFHDGKAICFDCDAVVNHKREVIGVMQTKALRGGHE